MCVGEAEVPTPFLRDASSLEVLCPTTQAETVLGLSYRAGACVPRVTWTL